MTSFTCHLDCGIESFEHHHPNNDPKNVASGKLRHLDEAYNRGVIFGLNVAIDIIKKQISKYDH